MSSEPSPQSNLRLKVTGGPAEGQELSVEEELVIGRESSDAGGLAGDIEISRSHARIARTPSGEWMIEDLGSRNGSHVNGHRIEQPELLAAGDAIELGGSRLVVQVSAPVTPPGPQPSPDRGETIVGDAEPAVVAPPEPEVPETEPPEAEPAEPEPPPRELPPVSLRIDLDVANGEARISLADESEAVRLVYDGTWRLRPDA